MLYAFLKSFKLSHITTKLDLMKDLKTGCLKVLGFELMTNP